MATSRDYLDSILYNVGKLREKPDVVLNLLTDDLEEADNVLDNIVDAATDLEEEVKDHA